MEKEIKRQLTQEEYLNYIKQWKEEHKEEIDSCKCKKVFLECLPRKNTININWMNSVGYKVFFIYGDIEGFVEIINVFSKKYEDTKRTRTRIFIDILYNNKIYNIMTDSLKKCKLGNILKKRTSDFKVEIGQIFKDNKRDLTIIDREYRNDYNHRKWCKYHCNKCGAELWMIEDGLLRGGNCACCSNSSNKTIIKGINNIATTHPTLVKYFVNIEDSYINSFGSNKKVLCKCPNCGYEKEMKICNLYHNGFSCPQCSDGIKYPEKLMFNFLQQLKENNLIEDFTYQYTKKHSKWCKDYRYDFYFKLDNEQYIIETHGEQHYRENCGKWGGIKKSTRKR